MIPQPPTPTPNNAEVTYQVMPQEGGKAPAVTSGPLPPVAPPPPLGGHPLPVDSGEPFFKSTKFYVIVAVLAAVILAAAGWFLFGSNGSGNAPTEEVSKLPSVWLKQHFDKTACDDKSICGDDADPDSDGLTNYDEFKAGTSPVNPDTDQDGLADGDEVHVYKTDPSLKYTDRRPEVASNNWTDAVQIKNGYDPNIPAAKLSEARLKQIADDTAKYGLHEPTKTTMGTQGAQAPTSLTYTSANGFEFQYPATWKKLMEAAASQSDYLPQSRTFTSVYASTYPAQDFEARVDVYNQALAGVLTDNTFIKGGTNTQATINNITWTKSVKAGDTSYLAEHNSKTYHVSGKDELVNTILLTFKFTN